MRGGWTFLNDRNHIMSGGNLFIASLCGTHWSLCELSSFCSGLNDIMSWIQGASRSGHKLQKGLMGTEQAPQMELGLWCKPHTDSTCGPATCALPRQPSVPLLSALFLFHLISHSLALSLPVPQSAKAQLSTQASLGVSPQNTVQPSLPHGQVQPFLFLSCWWADGAWAA